MSLSSCCSSVHPTIVVSLCTPPPHPIHTHTPSPCMQVPVFAFFVVVVLSVSADCTRVCRHSPPADLPKHVFPSHVIGLVALVRCVWVPVGGGGGGGECAFLCVFFFDSLGRGRREESTRHRYAVHRPPSLYPSLSLACADAAVAVGVGRLFRAADAAEMFFSAFDLRAPSISLSSPPPPFPSLPLFLAVFFPS